MVRPDQILDENSELYSTLEEKIIQWIRKEYALLKDRYKVDRFVDEYVILRVRRLCVEEDLASRDTEQRSASAGGSVSVKVGEQANIWKVKLDQLNQQIKEAKGELTSLSETSVLVDKPQYFSRV